MKKLFVILLTLALMITLIGNVSASHQLDFDDINGGITPTTPVEFHMNPTYLITVPSGIYFTGSTGEVHDWVNATNLVLEAGKTVTVSVTSEHDGKMFTHSGNNVVGSGLDYYLYTRDHSSSGTFSSEEVQLSKATPVDILTYVIPSGNNVGAIEKRIELKFVLEDISNKNDILSGTYKDSLTFIASYTGSSI